MYLLPFLLSYHSTIIILNNFDSGVFAVFPGQRTDFMKTNLKLIMALSLTMDGASLSLSRSLAISFSHMPIFFGAP